MMKWVQGILLVVVLFLWAQKIPGIIDYFKMQGGAAPQVEVVSLQGAPVESFAGQKKVLIFWATWCGPCEVELSRINRLIKNGDIQAQDVLAIVPQEPHGIVAQAVQDRGYQMPVALDPRGLTSRNFKVTGTPTVVLLDQDGKIRWVTSGLSPSLELRIKDFLSSR